MPDMMRSAIVTVPNEKSSGISVGEPFGGKRPSSRSATGRGPIRIAASDVAIAARFFPMRRDRPGATATASTAETK